MGKLRGLMDKVTHKEHGADPQEDASRASDDAFMHMTSRDTGFAASDKPEKGGGVKPVM